MNELSKRTITTAAPLTVKEVERFRDAVKTGDVISTIVRVRQWNAGGTCTETPRQVSVTIRHKYPYLVDTDYGCMTWNSLVAGYYGCSISAGEGGR